MCRKGFVEKRKPAWNRAPGVAVYREPSIDYLDAKRLIDTLTTDCLFTVSLT
jgi:hypothetical protein